MTLQQHDEPFHLSLQGISKPHFCPFLMFSSHFFCPTLLAPFTAPCRIVFALPEDLEMWPYYPCFCFFTVVRSSKLIMHCMDPAAILLIRNMVFVGNVQQSAIAPRFTCWDHSLTFCCKGRSVTGIKVDKISICISLIWYSCPSIWSSV